MTPHELNLHVQAFNEQQKAEVEKHKVLFEQSLVTAFYGAYWQRVEKLSWKSLEDVVKKLNKPAEKKQMTQEEMLNEIKRLNAAFGGTTY